MIRQRVGTLLALGSVASVLVVGCGGGGGSGSGGSPAAPAAQLLAATAPSNHYVEVIFANSVASDVAQPNRFRITGPGQTLLSVVEARITSDPTHVMLTTGPQDSIQYQLVVQNGAQAAAAATQSASFQGSSLTEPFLETAIALNTTQVLLTFSEPMLEGATIPGFYSIVANDGSAQLAITNAFLGTDGTTVLLTTSPQDTIAYTVAVTNVRSRAARTLINPTRNTATFFGFSPNDTTAPRLTEAVSTSGTTVLLSFSEAMADDAGDPTKYMISPPLTVVNAELDAHGTRVVLTTLPQTPDVPYTVTATGIADVRGNPIDPNANSATFTYTNANSSAIELPRVVSAASTGNTRVLVGFSKPMADSATTAAHYTIIQTDGQNHLGVLIVTAAQFLGSSHAAVELTTLSQSDVIYMVTVTNVTDVTGNALAPRQVVAGAEIDPATATFAGTPPNVNDVTDTDGDGLPDNVEQRGWTVSVRLTNRTIVTRHVTSDPYIPDTDGDGVDDAQEYRFGSDPRNADTDGDQLDDNQELNVIFSDMTNQDTDGDGIDDNYEVTFYRTNALLADSDGDGFSDSDELFGLNRDPRVADLPKNQISVGTTRLQIDERFTFTDEQGVTNTTTSHTDTTLTQSHDTSQSHSDGQTHTFFADIGARFGLSDQVPETPFIQGMVDLQTNNEWTFQNDTSSSESAQRAYEESFDKGLELSRTSSVTREIMGASIDAQVNLKNTGDVAYSISNVEITVSAPDPNDHTHFLPVATLIPNSTLLTGQPAVFNLGPLDPERGPIIFSNQQVYPNLVEDLMRNPRGLLFQVVNFDLTDESGRRFAFASQFAHDRTTGIMFDFGDGNVERHFVITAPVRAYRCAATGDHPNQYCQSDDDCGTSTPCAQAEIIGGWDAVGRPLGIPLDFALQDMLRLKKNQHTPDGILAGENGSAETIAQGDDVQLIPAGVDGLPPDTLVIGAGENGVLDTTPGGDDTAAVVTGYETSPSCGADTPSQILAGVNGKVDTLADVRDVQIKPFLSTGWSAGTPVVGPGANGFIDSVPRGDDVLIGPSSPCTVNADCHGGTCNGQEILVRVKQRRRGQFGRFWTSIFPDSTQFRTDFGQIRIHPGMSITFAFVQDIDRDGLIAQQEYLYGSSDFKQDTDSDGLDDFAECIVGWEVGAAGQPIRRVYSDPRRADSDGDGLTDYEEQDLRRVGVDPSSFGYDPSQPMSTDPERKDTDNDRVSDNDEVFGYITGGGIVDPHNVVIAGANATAGTIACPDDVCDAGSEIGKSCRLNRDCAPLRKCTGGPNNGNVCDNDSDCVPGRCDIDTAGHCDRTSCDDIQVVTVGTQNLDVRTVVVAPGLDGVLSAETQTYAGTHSDTVVFSGDGVASTRAAGDDQQVKAPGMAVGASRIIVRPGVDGRLESVPNSACPLASTCDDVKLFGQKIVFTDPLSPDTDADLLMDGIEQILGSDPTDPTDGGSFVDRDADGLTDTEETAVGWSVTVYSCGGGTSTRTVFSNPNVPDSDGDGLPDYLERILGTDPNSEDTDQDGIGDYDEFADFDSYVDLHDFFPGFVLDGMHSKKYGTNPTKCDTDGDTLSDHFELLEGYVVAVPGQGTAKLVFTNPTRADTDNDGLDDGAERSHGTDATNPDTDGDGRLDGNECPFGFGACSTDPLVPDIKVIVSVRHMMINRSGMTVGNPKEWIWSINAQKSDQFYPGNVIANQNNSCPVAYDSACNRCNTAFTFFDMNRTTEFSLRDGQGFLLNGFAAEIVNCPLTDGFFTYNCILTVPPMAFDFNTLKNTGFQSQLAMMELQDGESSCKASVLVEIATE